MANISPEDLRKLREAAQPFTRSDGMTKSISSAFLSLAPATSASYPQPSQQRRTSSSSSQVEPASAAVSPANKSRTSSLGADGAAPPAPVRFLKLGPVHWGEHLGDNKADWSDAVVE